MTDLGPPELPEPADPDPNEDSIRPIRRGRNGIRVKLSGPEAAVLGQLVGEVRTLLQTEGSVPDLVRERLLPSGNRADPDLARDFRELTEDSLRADKLADADTLLAGLPAAGGRVELDTEAAAAWLRTLNDLRLALGVQLDVSEDDEPWQLAQETGDQRWAVYTWLTAIQGLLIDALAG